MLDKYIAKINNDNEGLLVISLVNQGAVEVDWQMFEAERKELLTFSVQDEEQHLLLGCIMRADFDIYRRQGDYEYFIRYEKDTIEKMAQKMLKEHTFNAFNLQHNGETLPIGTVEMQQLFIKDTEKGIVPNGFEDCADGSLFGVFKINDESIWELCKQGVFNSFSLEGFFSVVKEEFNNKKEKFQIMNKLKEMLKMMLTELEEQETVEEVQEVEVQAEEQTQEEEVQEVEVQAETNVEEEAQVEIQAEEQEEEQTDTNPDKPEETDENQEVQEETKPNEVDALRSMVESLKSELEALKEEIRQIVNAPAVKPIVEEFEKQADKTDKMSKIAKKFSKLNK